MLAVRGFSGFQTVCQYSLVNIFCKAFVLKKTIRLGKIGAGAQLLHLSAYGFSGAEERMITGICESKVFVFISMITSYPFLPGMFRSDITTSGTGTSLVLKNSI